VLPARIANAVVAWGVSPSGSIAATVPTTVLFVVISGRVNVAAVTRGASLTAVTVNWKVSETLAPLESVAVTVIVVTPT
jgi:hypothetical protein